jgi:hypothetical protein
MKALLPKPEGYVEREPSAPRESSGGDERGDRGDRGSRGAPRRR